MSAVRCLWSLRAQLGEGPVYVEREHRVYFVDIKAPAVHAYDLDDGGRHTWPMPDLIGWLIPEQNGDGFIAGFRHAFARLWLEPGVRIELIDDPHPEHPGNRLNDAKRDANGHIFAGSMHDTDPQQAVGALFRLDRDDSWRVLDSGYHICNGPAISPDGRTLYHADSYLRRVYAYRLGADGTLSDRRLWREFDPAEGEPDGMTCAADGSVWIAHWGGSRISRFSAAGNLIEAVRLPVSQVTSCTFVDAAQERLIVTSARVGLTDEQLKREPLAGGLFEIRLKHPVVATRTA